MFDFKDSRSNFCIGTQKIVLQFINFHSLISSMIPKQHNGIKDPTNKFYMHRKKLFLK